ncbi:hypothetical protein [Halorubrum salipaludis]|uniref:hypothetical protein n=1 Tax=Halorubrum salipaludis TaxID=2032630 RepID=UPI0011819631|nr:hypothetical protein [Halorubrum salipaludis]
MTDPDGSDQSGDRDLSRVNTRVRDQRRNQADKLWREQPIERFLEARRDEITSSDLRTKEHDIRRFEHYLLEEIAPDVNTDIHGVRDAVMDDIVSFRDENLKPDPNLNDSTIADKLSSLSHFYRVLNRHNAFIGNPVTVPLKKFRDNHDLSSERPHIPFSRMQRFLNWLTYPFCRAFWLCGLKHGTRISEAINTDLRCLHLDHPVFWHLVEDHDVALDPRIRDKPDTMLIYEAFNEGDEIPNEDTPGPETQGEIRDSASGNKRKEKGGSILPVDSELKTALIEYLLVRPPTYTTTVNPLFVYSGSEKTRRPGMSSVNEWLWSTKKYEDSIQQFAAEEKLEECPTCGSNLVEENLTSGNKTGRRFRCQRCKVDFWRSIYWDNGLKTSQKVTFHQARHYFTNAHEPGKTGLHDGAIPDKIRKKRIRGDSDQDGDTEDVTYSDASYEQYNDDIREPYLNGIYKFDIYNTVIPAVGEGWDA